MENRVKITLENHVAHVQLVRGDKMNALDAEMIEAIIEAGERLKTMDGLRAVVLSGEGKAFCAGLDMGNFAKMAGGGNAGVTEGGSRQLLAERTHGLANRPQKVAFTWRELEVPVIAAAQGFALGGGFQIFMGADMRYAAPGTKFSIMESRWGLIPDMGTTHVMTRVAREDIVKELALTARIFEADEAYEHGFLTRVCENPVEAALDTAAAIASRNPEAVRGTKRLFNEPADRFVADTLMLESVLQDEIIGFPNQVEAVKAEMEGRAPVYEDVKPKAAE